MTASRNGLVFNICVLLASLALFLFSSSCGNRSEKVARNAAKEISYVQDKRTGLCFAVYADSHYDESGLTVVPCKKVKKYLVNGYTEEENDGNGT